MTSPMDQVRDLLARCNRCGFCQEVCPTYRQSGREMLLARGRNRLSRMVLEGRMDFEPEIKDHLYSCLLCGACVEACPPGVPTDQVVLAGRAEYAARRGVPLAVRAALRRVLKGPEQMRVPVVLASFYQNLGLQSVVRRTGFLSLVGALGRAEGLLPAVPRQSYRNRIRREDGWQSGDEGYSTPATDTSRGRVAYFLGCVTDNLFPEVAQATTEVLEMEGFQVFIPPHLCCGMAHRSYGDLEAAVDLAAHNLEVLERIDPDYVVSDCATCCHALMDYGDLLKGRGDELEGRASEVRERVRDISQLLCQEGFTPPRGRLDLRVAYHDPCHLARGLGVSEEPRDILRSVPGVEILPMDEAGSCCGGAGSYALTEPSLSDAILSSKMEAFANSGADRLSTSCPSCMLQLGRGGARLRGADQRSRPLHPIEVLYRSHVHSRS